MSTHVHILGIGGTFMGGVARHRQERRISRDGADLNVYPPMSTQLEALGIEFVRGYGPEQLDPRPDIVVVGNALSRGSPVVEAMLDRGLPYTSGPQWLAEQVLRDKHVLAVAGTHGKTTTTAMLCWMLEEAGLAPGFLIGGVPGNFESTARLGGGKFFVIEADEYDTAFFDKRAKFVHYPAAHGDPQQSGIRSRRHLSRRGLDPPPVQSAVAHRAGRGPAHRQRRGRPNSRPP